MSTPHERRRVLALVVGAPAAVPASSPLAHLVTLAEAALALAPVVEVRAPDTVLLDASAAHLFGGEVGLAEAVLALVAQLELSARVGLADGAWPARALARFGHTRVGGTPGSTTRTHEHAPEPNARETHGHPRWQAQMISRHLHESARPRPPPPPAAPHAPGHAHHVCLAVPGDNRSALAALPLSALELPAAVIERLGALGLDHLGALAELPTRSLAARFGALGEQAVRLARGIDPTPLTPHVPEEVPSEVHELEGGVEALEPLIFVSKTLAERLAARLAGRGVGATLLTLALTQESREVEEVPLRLTTPSTSTALWLPVLREAISALRLPAAVVRVRLTATGTAPLVVEQLALDAHPERIVALEAVLARLESRLGEGTVLVAQARRSPPPRGRVHAGALRSQPGGPQE
jgi:protein ImuB